MKGVLPGEEGSAGDEEGEDDMRKGVNEIKGGLSIVYFFSCTPKCSGIILHQEAIGCLQMPQKAGSICCQCFRTCSARARFLPLISVISSLMEVA